MARESELEFLDRQVREARHDIRIAATRLKGPLAKLASVERWTREFPLGSTAAAAVVGFQAGGTIGAKRRARRLRRERAVAGHADGLHAAVEERVDEEVEKKTLLATLLGAAVGMLRSQLVRVVMANLQGLRAETGEPEGAAAGAYAEGPGAPGP